MKDGAMTEKIWQGVLQALKITLSEGVFNTYLKPTQLAEIRETGERKVCEITCPSIFIKNTLEQRYWGQISEELSRITQTKCEPVFKVDGGRINDNKNKGEESLPLFDKKNRVDTEAIKKANLRPDYTFENYAVGGSNQMAFAAAQAVARKPGLAYNPLFIYGGVGVGKTHLMQAIGHEIVNNKGGQVLFCSGEEFTNDLVEAIRFKSTDKIRAKYRKAKLLMLDDVQFIAGKPSVQEEFFHTFNAIQKDGGQIVMTSDKPPKEINRLEERLKSRFAAGLIVDVGPADFELRTAILLIKSKQRGWDLPMEQAQLIAQKIEGVRELEGFLSRLITEKEVFKKEVTPERVAEILQISKNEGGTARIITPNEVMAAVGGYYNIGIQQLKSERRTKTIAWPRQILMYLLRNELKLPLEEVGRLLGGRDHTTIMHGAGKVQVEMETNEGVKREVREIKQKLFKSPVGLGAT